MMLEMIRMKMLGGVESALDSCCSTRLLSSVAGDVSSNVNVIVEMTVQVIVHSKQSSTDISNELPLAHLVFDLWVCQVDGEHNQTEAEDVNCLGIVVGEAAIGIAPSEAGGKLFHHHVKVGVPGVWGFKKAKELPKGVW